MANEPTFNPNAYREFEDVERRNRAVQDLYEPGSTFKVVTASAAHRRKGDADRHADRHQPRRRSRSSAARRSATRAPQLRRAVVHRRHRRVEQRRRDQDRLQGRHRAAEPLRVAVRVRPPVSPDFPGESPGIVWSPDEVDRQRAGVGVDGLSGRRDAAADGRRPSARWPTAASCVEPRVVRAIYRDDRRYAVQPKVVRRTISADTAATLTAIMEGVVERGTARQAAQIPGYTIAGKTGTAAKLINGHYSTSDYNASFVGFVPSRDPAVAIIVVIDSPHGRPAISAAPCRRRCSSASRRRRCAISASGRRSTRRRRCSSRAATTRRRADAAPAAADASRQPRRRRCRPERCRICVDMSAREAVRTARRGSA